jgi:hypothetical protein
VFSILTKFPEHLFTGELPPKWLRNSLMVLLEHSEARMQGPSPARSLPGEKRAAVQVYRNSPTPYPFPREALPPVADDLPEQIQSLPNCLFVQPLRRQNDYIRSDNNVIGGRVLARLSRYAFSS